MNGLKALLVVIYPALILLLVLAHYTGCCNNMNECERVHIDTVVRVDTLVRVDTVVLEENSEQIRRARETGNSGDLKITLLWDFPGDIDLHVKQPNGKTINYRKTKDRSTGGFLDVDNRRGGNGSAENIYWEHPISGEYQVSLEYYQPSEGIGVIGAGDCTVVVFQKGREPQSFVVRMSTVKEKRNIVTFNI